MSIINQFQLLYKVFHTEGSEIKKNWKYFPHKTLISQSDLSFGILLISSHMSEIDEGYSLLR